MDTLKIHLFKDSFDPMLELLNEHDIKYQMQGQRAGVISNSSMVVEIIQSPAAWGALATVLVAFLKYRSGRKVMITTKDNKIIHVEGLTAKELEKYLEEAKWLTAIDPNKNNEG